MVRMSAPDRARRSRSLRLRTLVPAFAVGALLVAATLAGVQTLSRRHLEARRVVRARMVAHLIASAAGSTSRPDELQRLVDALSGEREVTLIVIAAGDPPRVVASSRTEWLDRPLSSLSQPDMERQLVTSTRGRSESALPLANQDLVSYAVPMPGSNG